MAGGGGGGGGGVLFVEYLWFSGRHSPRWKGTAKNLNNQL